MDEGVVPFSQDGDQLWRLSNVCAVRLAEGRIYQMGCLQSTSSPERGADYAIDTII